MCTCNGELFLSFVDVCVWCVQNKALMQSTGSDSNTAPETPVGPGDNKPNRGESELLPFFLLLHSVIHNYVFSSNHGGTSHLINSH